jgi:hypothetical protein
LPGLETGSVILREEHEVRVLENGALREMLGPPRRKVTGNWTKLHNEKLLQAH